MTTHADKAGPRPVILCIGGTDPTGRAGLAADIRAAAAEGAHCAPVVATLTVQNAAGLKSMQPAGPLLLRQQIQAVLADLPVAAVKTGMIADAASLEAVVTALEMLPEESRPPLVIDPVLRASPGGRGVRVASSTYRKTLRQLARFAALATPNLPEAAALLGELPAGNDRQMRAQAADLARRWRCPVLLKGGHLPGTGPVIDVLARPDGATDVFLAPRQGGESLRATGCTLATLIAVHLGRGQPLHAAVQRARARLHAALADRRDIGGAGPPPVFLSPCEEDRPPSLTNTDGEET